MMLLLPPLEKNFLDLAGGSGRQHFLLARACSNTCCTIPQIFPLVTTMSKNFPVIFHGQKIFVTIFPQFPNLGLGNNNVDDASSTTTRKKFFGPGGWKRSSTLFVGEGMFEHVL